jgi:hypothetical protein
VFDLFDHVQEGFIFLAAIGAEVYVLTHQGHDRGGVLTVYFLFNVLVEFFV